MASKRKGAKVHGPGVRLSELYCGNAWTPSANVSYDSRAVTCQRCISRLLREEIATARKEVIAGK